MTHQTSERTSVNHARAKSLRAQGPRLAWPEVLTVIQGAWARPFVLSRFRAAGFTGDHWSERKAREFLAHLLTSAEDTLELRPQARVIAAEQYAIRALRRRLELELWT